MRRPRTIGLAAVGAVAALVAGGLRRQQRWRDERLVIVLSASAFNAAVTRVVNPSTHKGGTIIFDNSSAPDSTDAGNTYYAFNLNFVMLYALPLTTYKSCPGTTCGNTIVPGLATTLGVASDGNKTWTYHLKSGVKFEDGTPVTSQDVKYAVERTFDRAVLPNGPSYFASLLAGNAASYKGPFKNRSKNLMGLNAVRHAELDDDRVPPQPAVRGLQLRGGVPADRSGAAEQGHRRQLPAAPDIHRAVQVPELPAEQAVHAGAQPAVEAVMEPAGQAARQQDHRQPERERRTTSTTGCWPATSRWTRPGTGVQAAARAKILSTPSLKANSDDPINAHSSGSTTSTPRCRR